MEIYLVITNEYDYLEGNIKTVESYKDQEEAEDAFDKTVKDVNNPDFGYNEYPLTNYQCSAEIVKTASFNSDDDVISVDLVKIYL